MNEENTKDLTDSEKLNLILADLADTRADIGDIRREIRLLREDMWLDRKERVSLDERLSLLEGKPS
jgi:hypothetical protein